jgi:hypothetical protein
MADKIKYVKRRTPVRSCLSTVSFVSCCWMLLIFYGVHTGHVQYYPLVKQEVQQAAISPEDKGILSIFDW